jgi:hypothetical protein
MISCLSFSGFTVCSAGLIQPTDDSRSPNMLTINHIVNYFQEIPVLHVPASVGRLVQDREGLKNLRKNACVAGPLR